MAPLYRDGEQEATAAGTGPSIGAALAAGLIGAAVALALFMWLGYQVREGHPTSFDLGVRAAVRALDSPALTKVMWGASMFGAPKYLGPLALLAAAVFFHRGWRRGGWLTLAMVAGAVLLDTGLKQLFARARPEAFFDFYPLPTTYSFPSGHAMFSACFFGGLAALVAHRLESRWRQAALWVAALLLTLLIGVSRIYLGVHYPSDVLGGYAVGVVWVAALALGDRLAERRRRR